LLATLTNIVSARLSRAADDWKPGAVLDAPAACAESAGQPLPA
jgi:hypothetical protein